MKLSVKQKQIILLLRGNGLKHDGKNYFYSVSTNERRSGQMKVTAKELNTLSKAGIITLYDQSLTELGKTIEL